MTVIMFLLNLSVYLVLGKQVYVYSMDCSPFVLVSSISVFLLFLSYDKYVPAINYISSSVLIVYLSDGLRLWVNGFVKIEESTSIVAYIGSMVAIVVLVFMIAVASDKLRLVLFGKFENRLCNYLGRYMQKVYSSIMNKLVRL